MGKIVDKKTGFINLNDLNEADDVQDVQSFMEDYGMAMNRDGADTEGYMFDLDDEWIAEAGTEGWRELTPTLKGIFNQAAGEGYEYIVFMLNG